MSRHVVARVSEVPPEGALRVTVKGRPIALFNLSGEFFALYDRCPHEGASLCAGRRVSIAVADTPGEYRLERRGEMIRCPWHGWDFDIRTGQSWCDPEHTRVRRYAVSVEAGERLAKGPFRAESVPVSVEDDYLVVEV